MPNHKGYRDLLLAVMRIQILDFTNGFIREDLVKNKKGKDKAKAAEDYRTRAERAKDWILSNERNHVFSFISICKIIELDPDKLRKKIMAIKYPKQVYAVKQKAISMQPFKTDSWKWLPEIEKSFEPSDDPYLAIEHELEPELIREIESKIRKNP